MQTSKILNATVIVTALGYLVDIYDVLIFNVTRVASLTDLGLTGTALTDKGLLILNMQLLGMMLGGLFFGVMGDKIGRKQCLMVSILLYSSTTLLCSFVQNAEQYAALRLLAGFGLAGEIGVGIALISESMTKETRTLGVTFFTAVGISGAVIAALAAEFFSWRTCYIIGGLMGFALLATRTLVMESGLFEKVKEQAVDRGNFLLLLTRKDLFVKYIMCILVATPIWFIIGMIWTLGPEVSTALGSSTPVKGAVTVGIGYAGLMVGGGACGLLSYFFKNRKKVIFCFVVAGAALLAALLSQKAITDINYYCFSFALGLAMGYWINFVSIAAEQFGTNIRATVSTSIPNFARASLLPINLIFSSIKGSMGVVPSISLLAGVSFVLALIALWRLEETFHKELDYLNE